MSSREFARIDQELLAEAPNAPSEAPMAAVVDESSQRASGPALVAVEAAPLDPDAWQVITILPRLDAECLANLMTDIHTVLAEGSRRIALDLSQNQFFSLNAIQLCMTLARDLAGDDGGLALIGCPERTRKHIDVYGSLKQIRIVRSLNELVSDRNAAVVLRRRS